MLLRDPIHGDIELNAAEAMLLDLPVMQRLRGVRQLGTASLVYPGALHTRFDHSIGTCAVAHRIVASLVRGGHIVDEEIETAIGAAALLHDITHVPYGHTLEDERRLFMRHDKGTRLAQFLAGELGDTLRRLGLLELVSNLLGQPTDRQAPMWARDIVSGAIDADLLDYLRRDSYCCGLSHDFDDRIFRALDIGHDRLVVRLARHGMDRPDARSEVIRLLRLRYFLTERVYYHHTKVVAGAMLSKAVELALAEGSLSEAALLDLNDWTLLDLLMRSDSPATRALARGVRDRKLLKRGYVVSGRSVPLALRQQWVRDFHENSAARTAFEQELANALGLPFEQVVLYCPALTLMKEAAVPVETGRGFGLLNDPASDAYDEIHALESSYADLWRFYLFVPEQARQRMASLGHQMLGVPSEYSR